MNSDKKPRLATAIVWLIVTPVLTVGMYGWAQSVAKGEHAVVKSRLTGRSSKGKQAIVDAIEGVLRVLRPQGALAVGCAGIGASVAYMAQVLRKRRGATDRPALETEEREVRPSRPMQLKQQGPATCRHCNTVLTSKEARRSSCAVCGKPLAAFV